MTGFMIRFLICNLFISGMIGMFLIGKKVFKNYLTSRMQYNLWFLVLGLLAVPLIPLHPAGFFRFFSWLDTLPVSRPSSTETLPLNAGVALSGAASQINDLAVSVSRKMPSTTGLVLWGIWISGMLAMILLILKSRLFLKTLERSALPLQSPQVRLLYDKCLDELGITVSIPIYSTAFLKSPVLVGLIKPRIYLPIHLISDYHATDMRYILLHELQHYKHKDAWGNYLMSLAGILYWFNPLVWYGLKEMRNDREIACDTSVLELLEESDYEGYGNTLIDFAQKISLTPFPFAEGISGTMKQMQKRIINIASYQKPSPWKQAKSFAAWGMIAVFLLSSAPLLSTYAADQEFYKWDSSSETISAMDLSAYFSGYEGSFVLYDLTNDTWSIYDMNHAVLRTAPNSTYKIYDALFGLESGIITPENSFLSWDGTGYPFEAWNADQDLDSAMNYSVNWYFQAIDRQLGVSPVQKYLHETGYGNQNISADLSSYWMESSLLISPVEQVQLLTKLYTDGFGFAPENVAAVKESILLSSSSSGNFYGKTGTGRIDGQDVNGWFIGCLETSDHTCFFAANITSTENATGGKASEISLSILSDMGIWKSDLPRQDLLISSQQNNLSP